MRRIDLRQEKEGAFTVNRALKGLEVVLRELSGPGMRDPVDLVHLQAHGEDLVVMPVSIQAEWGQAYVAADIDLSVIGQRAAINAYTRNLGISQLESIEAFSQLNIAKSVRGLDLSRFSLVTEIDFKGNWDSVRVRGDSGPIAYRGVWLHNAWGEMTLFPDRIELHDFAILGPLGHAAGDLGFNWRSKYLDLRIVSEIVPTSINAWMEPWWVNLWKPFTFDANDPPKSDFYVSTTIGKWRSTRFFGQVEAGKTAYRDAWFDSGSARVWGKPRFTEVYDLEVQRPEGEVEAQLSWTFLPDRYGLWVNEYALDGRLDLRNGEKALPGVVRDITANFDPSEAVDIRSRGHAYGWRARPEERIRPQGGSVEVSAEAPIGVYGVQLDGTAFTARFGANTVDVSGLKFSAGGGSGSGEIRYRNETDSQGQISPVLELDLDIAGLRRDRILSVFPMLGGDAGADDDGNARIALKVGVEGDPRDLFSFSGNGQVRMAGGNLNELGLFGGLSNALSDTAFPMGSLSLNEVRSRFEVSGPALEFEDIKGSGRGVQMMGDGSYRMDRDHMNFKLVVNPGNMSETPVYTLLTAILRPVASAFPIRVWGPIAEPEWALDLFTNDEDFALPELDPVVETPLKIEDSQGAPEHGDIHAPGDLSEHMDRAPLPE